MSAIEERTEELREEAYRYSHDVHSKVDSLLKDVLLESVVSEYRNASARMDISERQLFDDTLVQSIAEQGTEIMHCATMLFLGMVDDATTLPKHMAEEVAKATCLGDATRTRTTGRGRSVA